MILKALLVAAMLGAAMFSAHDALAGHRGEAGGVRERPPWSGSTSQPSRARPSRERGNFRAPLPRRGNQNTRRNRRSDPGNIQRAQRRRDQDYERDRRRGRRDRRRRGQDEQDRARDAVRGGQARPLGEIIARVQNVCPGTFLGASLQRQGQGYLYRVRILRPSGRRITFMVDAASGAIVGGRCR